MDIIRSIARWLCAIGLGLAIGAWIFVATTSATALNRDTTKQWLDKSGIYSTNLSTLMQVQTAGGGSPMVSHAALDKALSATFTPDYIQQSTETALDGVYDWLDGKTQAVAFTVAVQDKADEFKLNLTNALSAELESLPTCTTRLGSTAGQPTCIPPGMTAQSVAQQIADRANHAFLTEPITPQSIQEFTAVPTAANQLPQTVQFTRLMVVVLPIVAIALGGLFILCSPDKLRGMLLVGRQMVFSSVFLLTAGLVMWYVGNSVNIGTDAQSSRDAVSAIVNPVIQTIVPGIGSTLSLFSGVVTALGATIWVVARIMINKRPKALYAQPQGQPAYAAETPATQHAPQMPHAQPSALPQQAVQQRPTAQPIPQQPLNQQPVPRQNTTPGNRPKPPVIQ